MSGATVKDITMGLPPPALLACMGAGEALAAIAPNVQSALPECSLHSFSPSWPTRSPLPSTPPGPAARPAPAPAASPAARQEPPPAAVVAQGAEGQGPARGAGKALGLLPHVPPGAGPAPDWLLPLEEDVGQRDQQATPLAGQQAGFLHMSPFPASHAPDWQQGGAVTELQACWLSYGSTGWAPL